MLSVPALLLFILLGGMSGYTVAEYQDIHEQLYQACIEGFHTETYNACDEFVRVFGPAYEFFDKPLPTPHWGPAEPLPRSSSALPAAITILLGQKPAFNYLL